MPYIILLNCLDAGFTRGLFNRRADARKRLIVNKRVDHVEGELLN